VVTILVLVLSSVHDRRENQPPAHLGLNYFREDR
jgi:simple sugar transport system permease protein